MFVVTFEDGGTVVEGKDVESWNDLPKDRNIVAVGLTDGVHLFEQLSGYSQYVVCVNAEMNVKQAADAGSGSFTFHTNHRNSGQTLWGIRDDSVVIQQVHNVYHDVRNLCLEQFENVFGKSDTMVVAKAKAWQIAEFDKRLQTLLENIHTTSVVKITLGFQVETLPRAGCNQDPKVFRQGIQNIDVKSFRRTTKDFFLKDDA